MLAGVQMIGSALFRDNHFGLSKVVQDPDDLKDVRIVVLHGGEDISPSIYGEVPVYTRAGQKPSYRDAEEMAIVTEAVRRGIPILGICRGAQLLCAMHGGHLYQHVSNHAGNHHLVKVDNNIFHTNSYHHQMMIPDKEAVVLGTTLEPLSKLKFRQNPREPEVSTDVEPEIVWFPKFRALGVQGHPEWLPEKHPLNQCISSLLLKYANVELFK